MDVTREVAQFVAAASLSDVHDEAVHSAQRLLIESVAVSILGSRLELGQAIARPYGLSGVCYAVPTRGQMPLVASAAFVNAAWVDCSDSVGGAQRSAIHPGKNVLPAVFTAWLATQRSGRELLLAATIGAEVAFRLDLAMGLPHKLRGHYSDGTLGAVAAAVALAKLHDLSSDEVAGAMGIACLLAPATVGGANMFTSSGRPLAMGQAAAAAVTAVEMAREGVRGPRNALGCRDGFADALSGVSDLSALTEGLGDSWWLPSHYLKPYVGCRLTHAARENVLRLKHQHRFSAADVVSMLVRHPEQDIPVIAHHTTAGDNVVACSCSEPYLLANVLIHEDLGAGVLDGTRIQDPAVHELAERIQIGEDEELTRAYSDAAVDLSQPKSRPVEIEIVLASGKVLSCKVDRVTGDCDPSLALTDGDLTDKFVSLTGAALSAGGARSIVALLEDLLSLEHPGRVASALS